MEYPYKASINIRSLDSSKRAFEYAQDFANSYRAARISNFLEFKNTALMILKTIEINHGASQTIALEEIATGASSRVSKEVLCFQDPGNKLNPAGILRVPAGNWSGNWTWVDGLLHTVRTFSDDIRMKFGLDKCAIAHCVNGKLSGHNPGVKVRKTETIKGLEPGQVYKYLGVDESNGIQHSTMRERLRREYFRRVKMVLRTELYGRNKVLAINGLALPVLTYSFGVIHWRTTDLQQLDRRTRKLLTMHGVLHPSADVDRLYAPCNEGGRGLQQIEAMYKSCIVGFECYLRDSSDPYM